MDKTRSSNTQLSAAVNQTGQQINFQLHLFHFANKAQVPSRVRKRKDAYAYNFALRKTHFPSSSWFVMVFLFGKQKRVIYCTNDPTNTVDGGQGCRGQLFILSDQGDSNYGIESV